MIATRRVHKALTKQEETKRLLGCSKNVFFKIAAFYVLDREEELSALSSKNKVCSR